MSKTWPQVKALLDDPSVPAEQKTALVASWQRENPGPGWPESLTMPDAEKQQLDEVQKYAQAYNATPILGFQSVDNAYDSAKKAGDQAGYNEHQEKKAVDDGKSQLGNKQPPSSGGGGTKTSDELFDAAEPALKLFQTFGSLLAKIPDDCRGNTRPLDYNNDIKKRFDEQRGISFQNFLDDADHFKTGSTTVDGAVKDTGTALTTLFHTWSGSGANSASDHYNDQIKPKATKLSQTLEDASEATKTAVSTVFQLCKGKADAIVNMYTDQVGKADYAMAQKVVGVANGEHAGKDDLQAIAGWMDLNFGTNLVQTLNDDGCCDDDDIKKQGQDLAKQWIQNQFNPDLWDRLYQGFDKTCTHTKDLVNQAYDSLDDVMGKIKNEFTGDQEPPGNTHPSHTGTGTGTGTGSGGGGTGSGGGGGGGGSMPSTPSATDPSTATPSTQDPSAVADAAKKEAGDGINPYTGKPMEVDPQTGQPYPIDPKTGEAIKDTGDQETLKVQQGDRTIEMSEPGQDGQMDIKVGDGTGQPKDYKLDWGDGTNGPGTGVAQDGTGQGPQGAQANGQPGPDGAYQPGPDGKIHIQDGDVKITAERPQGPDGPTVVTVDDGSGQPTTYTLGDRKPDASGADGVQSMVGTGNGSALGADGVPTDPGAAGGDGTGGAAVGDGSGGDGGGGGGAGAGALGDGSGGAGAGGPGGSDGGALGGSDGGLGGDGGAGGAGGTVPATTSDGLTAVGSGVTGGADGAVGGSLGDTTSLGAGAESGSAAQQSAGASLGAAPAAAPPDTMAAQQQSAGSGSLGSMGGMMGGMGAAGGGGGEDQERGSRSYRIDGGIFNSGGAGGRISGSLDDEGDRSVTQR